MLASVQQRQPVRRLGTMMKEKEEELALFLEMRKREKEQDNLLLQNSEEFDGPLGSKPDNSPIFKIVTPTPARKTGADEFLNSENDKNDYDWLLTPPGTPLFPSLEMESQKMLMNQIGTPKTRPASLKSRLANPQTEAAPRDNSLCRQPTSLPGLNSTTLGIRRPSSSGGPVSTASRPQTPTGRPTLTAPAKPSRSSTPTSRTTLPSSKSTAPARSSTPTSRTTLPSSKSTAPARSSTPTSRTTLPSSKSTAPARSSTPTTRSVARSSTPTARPTVPASKPISRSATPTRRTPTTSSVPRVSAPPGRSSSVTKSAPTTATKPVPSRGSSPTVKSRPWKPSEMPGFSLDVPPNLRTSLPERPVSASRGRPGAPTARSSSVEAGSNGRTRRQSCSPSRGRTPNGSIHTSGSSVPAVSRSPSNVSDNVSPVVIGTKMVERVINMRKLAPPKRDDPRSTQNNSGGKSSSSPDSSGFGRTLSKKSLDMALRHMDIRRSIPGNLRPLMTNIPASSMYSVRSGTTRSRTVSVSDSPLATCSNASSEQSVNNNALCLDGSEVDDDLGSERGG
ncbi:flocculation protein FLO11-like isoform X2 [Telopea speciosissima]|nr:flocculation protein FLO11-like isoform X2 [Telopea speciosissima]